MNDGVMNRMHSSSAAWGQKVGGLKVGPAGRERNKPIYVCVVCRYARRVQYF
jgi:hypothetical protein